MEKKHMEVKNVMNGNVLSTKLIKHKYINVN